MAQTQRQAESSSRKRLEKVDWGSESLQLGLAGAPLRVFTINYYCPAEWTPRSHALAATCRAEAMAQFFGLCNHGSHLPVILGFEIGEEIKVEEEDEEEPLDDFLNRIMGKKATESAQTDQIAAS